MEKTKDSVKEIVEKVSVLIKRKDRLNHLIESTLLMTKYECGYHGLLVSIESRFKDEYPIEKIKEIIGDDKMKLAIGALTKYLIDELNDRVILIDDAISIYTIIEK